MYELCIRYPLFYKAAKLNEQVMNESNSTVITDKDK